MLAYSKEAGKLRVTERIISGIGRAESLETLSV